MSKPLDLEPYEQGYYLLDSIDAQPQSARRGLLLAALHPWLLASARRLEAACPGCVEAYSLRMLSLDVKDEI